MLSKIPLWLQITLGLVALSIVGPLLGAVLIPLESWLFAALLLVLARYPGRDPLKPRIFRLMPWVLGLNTVTAALLLYARFAGEHWFDELGEKLPTLAETWFTLILSPSLLAALVYRNAAFWPVLYVSAGSEVFFELIRLMDSPQKLQTWSDFLGSIASNLVLVTYFLRKRSLFR